MQNRGLNVRIRNTPYSEACGGGSNISSPGSAVTLFFEQRYTFKEAVLRCRQLGGSMILPQDANEVRMVQTAILATLKSRGLGANSTLSSSSSSCDKVWIPVMQGNGGTTWLRYSRAFVATNTSYNGVTHLPWGPRQPDGADLQKCVAMGVCIYI